MVRGATLALVAAVTWASIARASVLVPTYVLPPESFVRDHRSLDSATADSQRTIKRLIGGHIKINPEKHFGYPTKNSFAFDKKSETGKFAGVIVNEQSGGNVGWNQGLWDDGMLMSSDGAGKEKAEKQVKDDDDDVKTLSDQVAEGKYGLLQNEIFSKPPKRPGIVSYEPNSETRSKDNIQSLGGLKKDEIWLAEDHLLVLKGGSFPERTKENDRKPWPPIDDYQAPRRQVKLPSKPVVPPPFPVRLSDSGPLVFLTPQGPVDAGLGGGRGPTSAAGVETAVRPDRPDTGDTVAGGAPHPPPAFAFLPGNADEVPINASIPDYPPAVAFLPPPNNQTDLYDEDDPSIYYPPPYNFSYHADYRSNVPAGPLVPGIVLPPPPDFFAPLDETTTRRPTTTTTTTRTKATTKRPYTPTVYRKPYKTRPTTTEATRTTEQPTTIITPPTVDIVTTPVVNNHHNVVQIQSRPPIRHNLPDNIITRPKTEKPAYKTRTKLTSKPLSVSVLYDYPEKASVTSAKPYILYSVPKGHNHIQDNLVTSTPVPLRAYFSNIQNDEIPTTKLQPVYKKPTENSVASFYFYDEQPKNIQSQNSYFDTRHYYKTVPSQSPIQQSNVNMQGGFNPAVDVAYGSFDQADAIFLWPQKQGPRTLTQEYFSIQKPRPPTYQNRPSFYQHIADIQQTLDLYTTNRPKHSVNRQKAKAITARPVYQFSYQSKSRPEEQSFRAPKLDPEPFRPMVSYSKPFNLENEFNAITPSLQPQQYLIENVQVTTEVPTSSRYYPKSKTRDEEYDDHPVRDTRVKEHGRNYPQQQNDKGTILQINHAPSTTPSAINHGYYTKQDERYFDDVTKNSFDVFGKKIEDHHNGLSATPPLGTVRTPIDNNINLQYAYEVVENQRPPSLDRDTLVNERYPRPPINPDSEQISPQHVQIHHHGQLVHRPPSLATDTLVNEKLPRPTINPDSEFIPIPNPEYQAYQSQVQRPQYTGEQLDLLGYRPGKPGSFVSYRLPGQGAHVYFLTPQAARQNTRYPR